MRSHLAEGVKASTKCWSSGAVDLMWPRQRSNEIGRRGMLAAAGSFVGASGLVVGAMGAGAL